MNVRDFITERITLIAGKIKGINIRYAFDNLTDFHIVEVSPEKVRRGNKDYVKLESNFWYDFAHLFPEYDLQITGIDELNDMSNLIFETSSDETSKISSKSLLGSDRLYIYPSNSEYNNNFNSIGNYALAA